MKTVNIEEGQYPNFEFLPASYRKWLLNTNLSENEAFLLVLRTEILGVVVTIVPVVF